MSTVARALIPKDIASAMELSKAANWNQTPEDWRRVLQFGGEGCRCIEDAGRIAATASLVPYGTRLAWIGMVLTRPEYRRRGFAKQLMEDLVARAEDANIRTLKLDATSEGRPLYESLGFVVEEIVERWGLSLNAETQDRRGDNGQVTSTQISDDVFGMDEEAFGASRRELLETLSEAGKCSATMHGYVLSRSGASAEYLGPCVASSCAEAELLIASHLAHNTNSDKPCDWYWDLLPANVAAASCAEKLGFTRRRTLWRMRRGEIMESNNAMVYAIAGFEWG